MENNTIKIKSIGFDADKLEKKFENDSCSLDVGTINVFVGPNGCGKTQLLKDIMNGLTKYKDPLLLDGSKIVLDFPLTYSKAKEIFKFNFSKKEDSSSQTLYHFPINMVSTLLDEKNKFVDEKNIESSFTDNKASFTINVAPSLISFFTTDTRLSLVAPQTPPAKFSDESYQPKNLMESMWKKAPDSIEKLQNYFKIIFGGKLCLYDAPGVLDIKYGISALEYSHLKTSKEKLEVKTKYPSANELGDGMRSVIGIICGFIASENKSIILLDEPEISLHPPQAYTFGKTINKLMGSIQQIFVSTHSGDILRGLVSASSDKDVNIFRITRNSSDKDNILKLDNSIVKRMANDPVLSSFRVLDALFYPRTIVCEGKTDILLYRAIAEKLFDNNETYFVCTYGLDGIADVIDIYKNSGINYDVILDCDCVLNNHVTGQKLRCPLTRVLVKHSSDSAFIDKINDLLHAIDNKLKLKGKIANDIRSDFKRSLNKVLKDYDLEKEFNEICNECARRGVFITQKGELESWLSTGTSFDNGSGTEQIESKETRFEKEFKEILSMSNEKIKQTDVGSFVSKIIDYLTTSDKSKEQR